MGVEIRDRIRGILDSEAMKICVAALLVLVPLTVHFLLGIGLVQDAVIAAGSRLAGKALDAEVWRQRFESIGHPYLFGANVLFIPQVALLLALYGTCLLRRAWGGREEQADRVSLALIFAAWLLITFMAALTHEPWEDELHAWQIAQFPLGRMFREMGYEGHFLLWFMLLHPFAAGGFPIVTLNILSWLVNAVGVWLLIRKSPFPVYVKILVMFAVPFLYFNPAISRPYVMIPLLLFLLAGCFRDAGRKPVRYCVLLVLLAHTHLYMEGFVGACGVLFLVRDIIVPWKMLGAGEKRHRLIGLGIAAAGGLFAVMQVLPAFTQSSFQTRPELHFGNAIYFFTVSGIRAFPARLLALAAMAVMLFHAYRMDKRVFAASIAGLLFMYLFSILIYPAFVENRAVIWFYLFLFTAWAIRDGNNPSALVGSRWWRDAAGFWFPLALLSVLLFQPERNAHDLNHDFYPSVRPVCDYINEHVDASVPVFSTQDSVLAYLGGRRPVYAFDSFPPQELEYRSYTKGSVSLHDEEILKHFASNVDALFASGNYGRTAYFIFFLLPGEQVDAVRQCMESSGDRYAYTVLYPRSGSGVGGTNAGGSAAVTDGVVLVEVKDRQ